MKLIVASVGKLKAGPERDLHARYAGRLRSAGKTVGLAQFDYIELKESFRSAAAERKSQECAALLSRVPADATLVALDENGEMQTSQGLAKLIGQVRDSGAPSLVFVIGGPDGHDQELLDRAARVMSLGAITLPHGLARVVLAEQLYRAVTILTGHPYHRD